MVSLSNNTVDHCATVFVASRIACLQILVAVQKVRGSGRPENDYSRSARRPFSTGRTSPCHFTSTSKAEFSTVIVLEIPNQRLSHRLIIPQYPTPRLKSTAAAGRQSRDLPPLSRYSFPLATPQFQALIRYPGTNPQSPRCLLHSRLHSPRPQQAMVAKRVPPMGGAQRGAMGVSTGKYLMRSFRHVFDVCNSNHGSTVHPRTLPQTKSSLRLLYRSLHVVRKLT